MEYDAFGDDNEDGCRNLTELSLPALLIADDFAFYAMGRNMPTTTINLPLLTTANDYCFGVCRSLTTINLPSLTTAGDYCFNGCINLKTINLPQLITADNNCFQNCVSLTTINLSSCTDLGGTVLDNQVFTGISGKTILATFNSLLATCNSGSPDGDIQTLVANNTVTITYV